MDQPEPVDRAQEQAQAIQIQNSDHITIYQTQNHSLAILQLLVQVVLLQVQSSLAVVGQPDYTTRFAEIQRRLQRELQEAETDITQQGQTIVIEGSRNISIVQKEIQYDKLVEVSQTLLKRLADPQSSH